MKQAKIVGGVTAVLGALALSACSDKPVQEVPKPNLNAVPESLSVEIGQEIYAQEPADIYRELIAQGNHAFRKPEEQYNKKDHPEGETLIPWSDVLTYYSDECGVPEALSYAVAGIESGFIHSRVGKSGERGILQIWPKTAKKLGVKDVTDTVETTRAGLCLLGEELKATKNMTFTYDGRELNPIEKAIVAYNAGRDDVAKNKIPASTRRHLDKVMRAYELFDTSDVSLDSVPWARAREIISTSQSNAGEYTSAYFAP